MSSNAHLFKGTDVTRLVKAVLAAGLRVSRVEADKTGKIVVVPGDPDKAADKEWDRT